MPAIYTHYAVAHALFQTLPAHIQQKITPFLPLYYFGSQGADFCFFYRVFGEKQPNLGSYLHRAGGYDAFQLLKKFSRHSHALFAYALGYLTHYAADATFHPYVYAMTGKSYTKHSRLEGALDWYFKPRLQNVSREILFQKPSRDEETELYILFSAIANKAGFPPMIKSHFSRAIFLFNAYPPISSAIYSNEKNVYIEYAINQEKRLWHYPADPNLSRNDNADELFDKAVIFAQTLAKEFCENIQNNTPLPFLLFGKNHLTGL